MMNHVWKWKREREQEIKGKIGFWADNGGEGLRNVLSIDNEKGFVELIRRVIR